MLQAGNHSAGSGRLEDRALSHESMLHVDDNQGAAARVDGEKAFPCGAGVGRHGLSFRISFASPRTYDIAGFAEDQVVVIFSAVRWLFPSASCLAPGAPLL